MTNRDFNKKLKKISAKGKLSPAKINLLTNSDKNAMIVHIVRYRQPVIMEFVNPETDMGWLNAMGYLYKTQGKLHTFLHTCEQRITQ